MPRAKRTVNSFNPRLLNALQEGCKREVRLSFPTGKEAVRCRQELNQLRVALRNEASTGWQQYTGVGIYLDKSDVVLKPKSSMYKDVLDAAGVPDTEIPVPDQDTNIATSDEASFFEDLKKLTRG